MLLIGLVLICVLTHCFHTSLVRRFWPFMLEPHETSWCLCVDGPFFELVNLLDCGHWEVLLVPSHSQPILVQLALLDFDSQASHFLLG